MDGFSHKRSHDDIVFKTGIRVKESTGEDGSIEFVMSDESRDASGDVIAIDGWNLDRFKTNPVALYGHSSSALPIGKWENVRIVGKQLHGRLRLAEEGTTPTVDGVRRLFRQGMLNACSVGFIPIDYEWMDAKDPWAGTRYKQQELLECSVVAVPANANAVAIRRALKDFPVEVQSALLAASGVKQPTTKSVSTGKSATTSPRKKEGKAMSLSERIQALQEELIGLQDVQAPLHKKLTEDEELTEEEATQFDETSAEIAALNVKIGRLRETEKSLGIKAQASTTQQTTLPNPGVVTERRLPKKNEKPMDLFVKMGVIAFLAHVQHKTTEQVRLERYPERADIEAVLKAVTNPAQTTVATWAAELVETANADWLETLQPMSVYAQLTALGTRFTFDRYGQIKVPRRNRPIRAPGDLRGSFIGEGQPIPVRRGSFGSITLIPHKFGVISTFTREMAMHSTPAIEGLIREGILEDSAIALDEVLLDAVAADAIRPAGLLYGVTAVPGAAGGGPDAMADDFGALMQPFIAANAADRLVLLINPVNTFKLMWATTPLGVYPFRDQVSRGNLAGVPLIQSTNVGAKDLIMLRAADFTSSSNDTPEFDVSDVATLHEDDGGYPTDNALRPGTTTVLPIVDGAGVAAKPVRSLWQTASIGVRMLQDVDWAMRRENVVAWVNNITW